MIPANKSTSAKTSPRRRSAQLVDFLRNRETQVRDDSFDEEIAYWKLVPAALVSAGVVIIGGGSLLGASFPGSGD